MSATQAQTAYKFVLSYSTTLAGTYTPVAAIEDFKPAKMTVEKIRIVRNDSPTLAGETIPGWIEPGEHEIRATWDKTSYSTIAGLIGDGTAAPVVYYWKLIRPDGTSTSAFQAFACGLSDEMPLTKQMTYTFSLAVSGMQTFTHS